MSKSTIPNIKSIVPENYKRDPYELVLYAIPKYKFRLFFVTYDRDLDVIHYLKYEKKKNWLQPENSGIPIIDRCFIGLDEVTPSEFEKFYMYLTKDDHIEICCLKNNPCDICKNLGKSFNKGNSSNRIYRKLNLT